MPDPDPTWNRIRRRLRQRRAGREPPPEPETLRQLRKGRRISQAQVAARLRASQGEVSRFERRPDMRVSTLRAYVEALGGRLELTVRFPGLAVGVRLASRQNA